MKVNKIMESIEKEMNAMNAPLKPNDRDVIALNPTYAKAKEDDAKFVANANKVMKDGAKLVKDEEPKKAKTESYSLAEDIFEDYHKNINEMTDDEIEAEEIDIHTKAKGEPIAKNPELLDRYNVIACIRMINSVLAYLDEHGDTTMGDGAEAVLDAELANKYSYLKKYVDMLGRDKVVELIQHQIDDIDFVQKNVATDSDGIAYNSIHWKKKDIEETLHEVEDLPDSVYELVYDRLFPDGVKYQKALILKENPIDFDFNRFYGAGLGDYDIGVAVKNEEEANMVKELANLLHLDYTFRDIVLKDGLIGVAIIKMTPKIGDTDAKKYLEKIGYTGAMRTTAKGKPRMVGED